MVVESKDSIKLTKNAKGVYQWEIKLVEKEGRDILSELDKINTHLENKYGKIQEK